MSDPRDEYTIPSHIEFPAAEDKPLPAAVHVEITVLGAILGDPGALNDAMEKLLPEDFSLDSHQRIYRAMLELAETGNPVELGLVIVELERKRELDSVGGRAYLFHLTEGIPRNFSIESYIKIVKDKSLLRQVVGICHDGQTRAYDQSEDARLVVSEIEERLLEVAYEDSQRGFTQLLDEVKAAGTIEDYVSKITDPAEMTGLATGFTELDKMLGGLKKGELVIVAARPGQGKSAFALCVGANVVKQDAEAVVPFFSLEMGRSALFRRLLASQAQVNLKRALEGWLGAEEKRRLGASTILFADKNLLIDDTPGISLMKMRAKCRRLKQKHQRLDLVEVDYIQLITGSKRYANRQEEVSAVSRGLKAMAKELDVPVLALAMVGRSSEQRGGDKRPMLSDLKESGQLEQDADVVVFVHRPDYYAAEDDESVERGTAEFIISKNREGSTGMRKLAYLANYTLFDNLAAKEA